MMRLLGRYFEPWLFESVVLGLAFGFGEKLSFFFCVCS